MILMRKPFSELDYHSVFRVLCDRKCMSVKDVLDRVDIAFPERVLRDSLWLDPECQLQAEAIWGVFGVTGDSVPCMIASWEGERTHEERASHLEFLVWKVILLRKESECYRQPLLQACRGRMQKLGRLDLGLARAAREDKRAWSLTNVQFELARLKCERSVEP